MRFTRAFLVTALFSVLALMASEAVAGGGNKEGTAAADQLLVPVGARGIALSGAYAAGLTGLEAIYYNPAGLSGTPMAVEVMFSQQTLLANDGLSYFGVVGNFEGFGHVAFNIKAFSFGDILITDERQPDGTGAVYSPTYMTLGMTYSRALTDRIRAGITANLVSEEMDRASTSGFAFDVGVQYSGLAGVSGLELGVALKHLGGNMKYDGPGLLRLVNEVDAERENQFLKIEAAGFQMPTSLEIAMAYTHSFAEMHKAMMAVAFENSNFLVDQYKLALEYSFQDLLFLRGSYVLTGGDRTDSFGDAAYMYGPAFGAGVKKYLGGVRLMLDYAYRTTQTFNGQHVFTLNLGF